MSSDDSDDPAARLARLAAIARARLAGDEHGPADPAHDFSHVARVAENARRIATAEAGADVEIAVAAAWLHELFNYPKDHPESHRSGEVCAEHALRVLADEGWPRDRAEHVAACIRTHSFSSGLRPETLEAAILQDADRLDAIGAIGIARCFATTATMRRPFYDPDDPACARRAPDDKRWGVDHFYKKLLRLPASLSTATGRALAVERAAFMETFLARLFAEIGATDAAG
jgi:uncharacterized protein